MTHSTQLPPHWPDLPLEEVARLAPVQLLQWRLLADLGLEIAVKREDLLHPQLGGNKFYKLHGHLQAFRQSGAHSLLSFGGAFSNHLYALAAAGRALGVPTIGVVRGERPAVLSPTLEDSAAMGMHLEFVSRAEYRRKNDADWQAELRSRTGDAYWLPEGAGDLIGSSGCALWVREALTLCPWKPDAICVAAGTGGTAAGVLAGSRVPVHAFLALKGTTDETEVMHRKIVSQAQTLVAPNSSDHLLPPSLFLESNYHCGGYARFPQELRQFVAHFEAETGMPLDPVYTAKLFWGIAHKAQNGFWRPGTRILVLHTGGLQGRRGLTIP